MLGKILKGWRKLDSHGDYVEHVLAITPSDWLEMTRNEYLSICQTSFYEQRVDSQLLRSTTQQVSWLQLSSAITKQTYITHTSNSFLTPQPYKRHLPNPKTHLKNPRHTKKPLQNLTLQATIVSKMPQSPSKTPYLTTPAGSRDSLQIQCRQYAYLNVQHNFGYQSYCSPYRLGDGFMNGYHLSDPVRRLRGRRTVENTPGMRTQVGVMQSS